LPILFDLKGRIEGLMIARGTRHTGHSGGIQHQHRSAPLPMKLSIMMNR